MFFCDLHFDKQEFMVMHMHSAYYANIYMLNAFRHQLCSLLCQHNRRVPTFRGTSLRGVVQSAIFCKVFRAKGVQTPNISTTNGMKSDPTFSTAAKCFSSLATSPAVAATPAHEAQEVIKVG